MLIKSVAVVIAAVSALPAFAQTTTKDAYVSAVIGGVSVAGLVLIVGIYKLGRLAMSKLKAIGTPVVQQAAATTVELKHPLFRPVESISEKVIEPSEDCWSFALSEVESESRRPGLWAKSLSDAKGNETLAKSAYLRARANELHLAEATDRQYQQQDAQRRQAATAYAQLASGSHSELQIIEVCEAQLRALGIEVHRPQSNKWEIYRNGSSFAYSVDDLRKLTGAFTAEELRKRAA